MSWIIKKIEIKMDEELLTLRERFVNQLIARSEDEADILRGKIQAIDEIRNMVKYLFKKTEEEEKNDHTLNEG
jgi:hypothetical protein